MFTECHQSTDPNDADFNERLNHGTFLDLIGDWSQK